MEFVAVGDFKTTRLSYTSYITKLIRVISKRLLNAKRNSRYILYIYICRYVYYVF